jgi:hypothetical protein
LLVGQIWSNVGGSVRRTSPFFLHLTTHPSYIQSDSISWLLRSFTTRNYADVYRNLMHDGQQRSRRVTQIWSHVGGSVRRPSPFFLHLTTHPSYIQSDSISWLLRSFTTRNYADVYRNLMHDGQQRSRRVTQIWSHVGGSVRRPSPFSLHLTTHPSYIQSDSISWLLRSFTTRSYADVYRNLMHDGQQRSRCVTQIWSHVGGSVRRPSPFLSYLTPHSSSKALNDIS